MSLSCHTVWFQYLLRFIRLVHEYESVWDIFRSSEGDDADNDRDQSVCKECHSDSRTATFPHSTFSQLSQKNTFHQSSRLGSGVCRRSSCRLQVKCSRVSTVTGSTVTTGLRGGGGCTGYLSGSGDCFVKHSVSVISEILIYKYLIYCNLSNHQIWHDYRSCP